MDQSRFSNGMDMLELGQRIRAERQKQRLSLDQLAARAGVSRSMISAVERGRKVPSAIVLDNIASGLGQGVGQLVYGDLSGENSAELLRTDQQTLLQEPHGRKRRNLLSAQHINDAAFERVVIMPNGLAGAFAPLAPQTIVSIAVERGCLQVTLNGTFYELNAGDSLTFAGDCVHTFANVEAVDCVYYWAEWR